MPEGGQTDSDPAGVDPPGARPTGAEPAAARPTEGDLTVTLATTCTTCGAVSDPRPPTWSLQVGERGATWLCDGCTRRNLRSIEGRLDEAWW